MYHSVYMRDVCDRLHRDWRWWGGSSWWGVPRTSTEVPASTREKDDKATGACQEACHAAVVCTTSSLDLMSVVLDAPCGAGAPLFPLVHLLSHLFPPFTFLFLSLALPFFFLCPSLSTRIVPLRFQARGCRCRVNHFVAVACVLWHELVIVNKATYTVLPYCRHTLTCRFLVRCYRSSVAEHIITVISAEPGGLKLWPLCPRRLMQRYRSLAAKSRPMQAKIQLRRMTFQTSKNAFVDSHST